MARYRHYVNAKQPGATLFVTTTVLDFVHAFRRDQPRDAMVRAIARECRLAQANLHSYVVMPHHMHMVLTLHESMNGPEFMKVLKKQSSPDILQLLTTEELSAFDQQRGLNGNTFWKYSFRSILIDRETMFWQKVRYTHLNPVHAGYVERPEEYRWSSSRLYLEGLVTTGWTLSYDAVEESLQR